MSGSLFGGCASLIRLILRRERIALPIWIFATAALGWASANTFAKLYPTQAALRDYATQTAGSPAVVSLLGPVFAPTLGGLVAWRWTIQGVFVIGLMSVLTVVRHTRVDEQTGRRELLGSTVVGRHAPLTAVLVVTLAANLVMAGLAAAGFIGLGLPAAGSIALPLSVAAVGCLMAAVTAVTVQLSANAGTARSIAGAIFGVMYLMRAIGDTAGVRNPLGRLSWLSPVGWARLTRAFASEQWWIFSLFGMVIAVVVVLAYALSARRDLGAGIVPERRGPATAARGFDSPLALAWRLQRGMLLAWAASFAVIGTAFGFVAKIVSDLLSHSPQLMPFFTRIGGNASPSDVVFFLYFLTFGPIIALYAILATQNLRSEEMERRGELLLAAPISRLRWMISHLTFAIFGPAIVLVTLGFTAGLTYGLSMGNVGLELPRVLLASIVYLPAVWVIGGVTTAQFGLLPRFALLSWGVWLAFSLIDFLANELRQLNQAFFVISPFAHVPKTLLGEAVSPASVTVPIVIAATLMAAGLIGFRNRDFML